MFGCEAVSDRKPGSELLWRGIYEGKKYYLTVTYTLSKVAGATSLHVSQDDFSKVGVIKAMKIPIIMAKDGIPF